MSFEKLLIDTKFSPPRLGARHIRRAHLLDYLRDTQRCAFTLVTGSAGYGKTILLAQWRLELLKAGADVAWLSLGHGEKQLPAFSGYLIAALGRLGLPADEDTMLEAGSAKTIDGLVAQVVRGAASVDRELYLIIDDYHNVEDPRAHRLMQGLLEHCPANLHFVIASRTTPPLSLGRSRVMGQVAELGFAELPFTLEESRLFFEQTLAAPKLSVDELRSIHDATQGWPASLQLIAIMLRGRPETRSSLRDLGWKDDLQAYLANDVLAHLPAELKDFLERVSACRRFNAELAGFVTQTPDAASLIERAEDGNLLIYRVESDDRSPWYRFHPLLAEFLAARLAQRPQSTVRALHRRASRWFAEHQLLVEAVRHATLAGDLDYAVQVIERAAPATWNVSYISPMLHLLDRLPQESLFAHPRLFFLGCLTYALTARPAQAEQWLAQVRGSEAARNPAISSGLALADATVALQRDDTQRVIDLLEPQYGAMPESGFLRYVYLAALVTAYGSTGRHADAYRVLDDNPPPPEDRDDDMALVVASIRASSLLDEGLAREAARLGATLLARAESAHGRRSLSGNLCAAILGDAYYELDRIDDAREVLANRTGILQASSPQVMLRASLTRARLDLLQETPDSALELLESQASHFQGMGLDRLVAWLLAEQVKILLQRDERERAEKLASRLDELGTLHREARGLRAEIPVIAALARARISLKEHTPEEALANLAPVRLFAERSGRSRTLVVVNLLSATALAEFRQDKEATRCLLDALHAGLRLGLVRSFLDEGKRVGELLARRRGDPGLGEAASYLEDLLGRFGAVQSRRTKAPSDPDDLASERAGLTPREVEILGLISQAMSNKRIALTLNITLETVKWNVKNILSKIGVSSRYDAMAWARKHGLIE